MELKPNEALLIRSLKSALDKLQKKCGIFFPCDTLELRQVIEHGVAVVNAMRGSSYTIGTLPKELGAAALIAGTAKLLEDKADELQTPWLFEDPVRKARDARDAVVLRDLAAKFNKWFTQNIKGTATNMQ